MKMAAYLKQYERFKCDHERARDYGSEEERQCGLNKTDRLRPVYLLWVYHGEEPWDGPHRLKDKYTTDLRELLDLLRRQSERSALLELVEKRKDFIRLVRTHSKRRLY